MRIAGSFHRTLLAAAVGAAAVSPAAAQTRLSKPIIDTLPHGIVRVRNPGPTQWTGTTGWKFVLERTITSDGAAAVIAQPTGLDVDRDGRVIETDWKVDGLQVFEADGRFARVIGRTGDGPGEFKAPIGIAVHGDTIVAFAGNQRRVTVARTDGKVLTQWRADYCCSTGPRLDAKQNVLLGMSIRVGSDYRRAFARLRGDGTVIDTIRLPVDAPVRTWDVSDGTWTIPFAAYTASTVDRLGRIVRGNSAEYVLTMSLHGEDTARIIQLPGTRAAIPPHAIDSMFAVYTKIDRLRSVAKRSDIPTEQAFFKELYADELNNIWIQRPTPSGGVAGFDVITADGRFLGTVAAPRTTIRLPAFRNGRMYCIAETADGDMVIEVYRIDKGTK